MIILSLNVLVFPMIWENWNSLFNIKISKGFGGIAPVGESEVTLKTI